MKLKNYFRIGLLIILEITLNLLIQLLPESIKTVMSRFSSNLGFSYTLFWFILTTLIVLSMLLVTVKGRINERQYKNTQNSKTTTRRTVNQYGEKSTYIENNKGNINIK